MGSEMCIRDSAGARPLLKWFHVSSLTEFYNKLTTQLVHAMNYDRVSSASRAISPPWGVCGVRYRRSNVLTFVFGEFKALSCAIGPTCADRDSCEGSLFQLLCTVKMVLRKFWRYLSTPRGEVGIRFLTVRSTSAGRSHSEGRLVRHVNVDMAIRRTFRRPLASTLSVREPLGKPSRVFKVLAQHPSPKPSASLPPNHLPPRSCPDPGFRCWPT